MIGLNQLGSQHERISDWLKSVFFDKSLTRFFDKRPIRSFGLTQERYNEIKPL